MNEIMNKGIKTGDWQDIEKVMFKQAKNLDTFYRSSGKKEEEELHSFFESSLKGRKFRGFCLGRTFVEKLGEYRHLVSLHRREKDLEKILIRSQSIMDYSLLYKWYGVTHGHGTTEPSVPSLETYMWVELDESAILCECSFTIGQPRFRQNELAIGQYGFSIEHLEFRQNEIIFKLKILYISLSLEIGDEDPIFIRLNHQEASPETKASPSGDTLLNQQKVSPETKASPSGDTLPKRKRSSGKKKGSSRATPLKQQKSSPRTNSSPSGDTLLNQQKSSPETKASPSGDTLLNQQKVSPETKASPSGDTLPKRKRSSRKKKGSSGATPLKQQKSSPRTNSSPSGYTLLNQQEASPETKTSPSGDTLLNQPEASPKPKASPSGVEDENERPPFMENTSERDENVEREIHLEDFIELTRQWGKAIKRTIYDFMANDINKENIKAALRCLGILCISLALATLSGIKFLCFFVLEFMSQFIRLMQILIPLILKLIDVLIKIVGVFCTLIAMMWRILRVFINMCFSTYIILDICIIFAFYFLYYYLK